MSGWEPDPIEEANRFWEEGKRALEEKLQRLAEERARAAEEKPANERAESEPVDALV